MSTLGNPIPHDSAREHVTGEAAYLDDLPPTRNELLVDFVGSTLAHARIKSVAATRLQVAENILQKFYYDCASPELEGAEAAG